METNKNPNTEELSAERSLRIISESIERSRKAMTVNAGNSYIAWGSVVTVTALVIGHLWMHNGGPMWNLLWATIFITAPIAERILRKGNVPETASHIGHIIGRVWLSMGIFASAIGFGTGLYCALQHTDMMTDITATIILLYGIATTITGFVLKNRLITATGLVGGLAGYFAALSVAHSPYGMVVLAAVAAVCGVLPGIVIKLQNRRSC